MNDTKIEPTIPFCCYNIRKKKFLNISLFASLNITILALALALVLAEIFSYFLFLFHLRCSHFFNVSFELLEILIHYLIMNWTWGMVYGLGLCSYTFAFRWLVEKFTELFFFFFSFRFLFSFRIFTSEHGKNWKECDAI